MLTLIALAALDSTTTSHGGGTSALVYLFGALGGVLITGVVTYLVARRTTSGRIDTTEAGKLWDESTAIRQELRNEVSALQARLDDIQAAHDECRQNENELRAKVATLEKQVTRRRTTHD